jgi:NIPSNAP protein
MFVEQRIYTFAPGNTAQFLSAYDQQGRGPQTAALGEPVGYYVNEIGPLNQITTMWAYGSLDERVARREKLFADPAWIAFLKATRPLMTTQETRILKPAAFFQRRLADIANLGRAS